MSRVTRSSSHAALLGALSVVSQCAAWELSGVPVVAALELGCGMTASSTGLIRGRMTRPGPAPVSVSAASVFAGAGSILLQCRLGRIVLGCGGSVILMNSSRLRQAMKLEERW